MYVTFHKGIRKWFFGYLKMFVKKTGLADANRVVPVNGPDSGIN